MTNREKTLGTLVAAVAVVGIGYTGVKKYRSYLADLDRQVKTKRGDVAKIEKDKRENDDRQFHWKEYGTRTLAADPVRLQNIFRIETDQLAKDCGLTNASVTLGKLTNLGKRASKQTEFVRVLNATVHAEGPVEQVMTFLFRLHAQPYMVRVKTLSLLRPSRTAPNGIVKMEASLETPILPATKSRVTILPVKLDDRQIKEVPLTMLKDFADYRKAIVRPKLFQPYEKIIAKAANPNPTVGQVIYEGTDVVLRWTPYPGSQEQRVFFGANVPSTQPVAELRDQSQYKPDAKLEVGKVYVWRIDTMFDEEETRGDEWRFRYEKKPVVPPPATQPGPPVPPPPPPLYADFFVGRVITSPLIRQVVLEDRKNPQAPVDKRVEIGEPFFDGVLVYLHAKGAVSEKDGRWRLHLIGEQVRNAQALTPDDRRYPDVYHEVLKLRDSLSGITEGPDAGPGRGG